MSDVPQAPGAPKGRSRGRRLGWLAVRIAVTAGALGWTLAQLTPEALLAALGRVHPLAVLAAVALTSANVLVGAVRWRALLAAYGAPNAPPIVRLAHIYFVGLFYNTFLPANVGGDVVRAFVTRRAFGSQAASFLVVGVERVFGLAGLFLLAASVLRVHPVVQLGRGSLPALAVLGLVSALAATAAPALARRVRALLPARLRSPIAGLPAVERPTLLLPVLVLSVTTQSVVALAGFALLHAIDPTVTAAQALVLVPVALVAMYLPTIGGLGTREAAFVVLFGRVGVAEADATAASLALFAVQLVVALLGGAAHLIAPLGRDE